MCYDFLLMTLMLVHVSLRKCAYRDNPTMDTIFVNHKHAGMSVFGFDNTFHLLPVCCCFCFGVGGGGGGGMRNTQDTNATYDLCKGIDREKTGLEYLLLRWFELPGQIDKW